ncbi:MAG: DUF4386 domain-containing protein [Candidatus Eremiobacteraeota bacterium]|nr:DUF4386 domain-containing protein [Candidatus Eremiobacteraeota bacterium]
MRKERCSERRGIPQPAVYAAALFWPESDPLVRFITVHKEMSMTTGRWTEASTVTDRIAGASPRLKARVAGAFYMINVVLSLYAFFPARGSHLGHVATLVAAAAYLVVTLLLYVLLKPVSTSLSLLAAFFSLEGVAHSEDSLFFFGFYCILLGYLIFSSAFLPRAVGVLTVLAGLGLLTNALAPLVAPALAHVLSPYGFSLDAGEIVLALWLLVMGVNVPKWEEKANRLAS